MPVMRERSPQESAIVVMVEEALKNLLDEYPVLYDVEILTTTGGVDQAFGYVRLENPPNSGFIFTVTNNKPEFLVFYLGDQYFAATKNIVRQILDNYFLTTYKEGGEEDEYEWLEKYAGSLIPKRIKKKIKRPSEREKMPKSYFLLPSKRKFPYRDPDTGEVHCGLVRAAITRAAQYGYKDVEKRARNIYQRHCKKQSSELIDDEILIKTAGKLIPERIKRKIKDPDYREKMPASYFLLPSERKFPYKDPDTGKVHCGLLRAAMFRARQHGYKNVFNKAKKIYEKNCSARKKGFEDIFDVMVAVDNLNGSPYYTEVADILDNFYSARKEASEKSGRIPSSYYLDPVERQYIYRNPLTGDIDPVLLYASVKWASIDKNADAYIKGMEIIRKHAGLKSVLKWGLIGALTLAGGYAAHRGLMAHSDWYQKNIGSKLEKGVGKAQEAVQKAVGKTKDVIGTTGEKVVGKLYDLFGKKKENKQAPQTESKEENKEEKKENL